MRIFTLLVCALYVSGMVVQSSFIVAFAQAASFSTVNALPQTANSSTTDALPQAQSKPFNEPLLRLERMATQQATGLESLSSPYIYIKKARGNYTSQPTWNKLSKRPYMFKAEPRKQYFDTSIPKNARRIVPSSPPTPLPKRTKQASVPPPKKPTMAKPTAEKPTMAKPTAEKPVMTKPAEVPSPPIVMRPPPQRVPRMSYVPAPETPPLPIPGPRNPLDALSELTTTSLQAPVDPRWAWPN